MTRAPFSGLTKSLTSSSRHCLHCHLRAETVVVAFDGGDRKIATSAAEANESVALREVSLDDRLLPFLRMAYVANRKVEMFRPEEWDHRKGLVVAQHVCGRDLTLTLGYHPMFDTNVFARMGIGPADDVAGGKNIGDH